MNYHKLLLVLRSILLASLLCGLAEARGKESPRRQESNGKDETSPFNLKVPVNVVVVNANITDKQGNPVKDLVVEDFKVYEDGKPQQIHTFARESYQAIQPMAGEKTAGFATPEPESAADRPHFVALMIDDLNAPAYDSLYRTVEAVKKYIAESSQAGNLIGITSTSGRIQIPFTSDVEVLRDQLVKLLSKLDRRSQAQAGCAELTESQAMAIETYLTPESIPRPRSGSAEDVNAYLSSGGCRLNMLLPEIQTAIVETVVCEHLEFGFLAVQRAADHLPSIANAVLSELHYQRRLMLNTLMQYIRSMRHFDGSKSLILFSEGFLPQPVRYELQDVVDMALRSGVYVNAIDIRGLYTTGPDASSSVSLPSGGEIKNQIPTSNGPPLIETVHVEGFLGNKVLASSNQQSDQKSSLAQLASETGGIFFQNSNDLYGGIKKVIDHQTFCYILTYASPDTRNDGRYHKIKLEVSRPGLRLRYREGYYAAREQVSSEKRKKEEILEALLASGNLNEIPIELSYQFSQISDSTYQLSLLTKVNVSRLEFLSENIRHKNSLSLVVAAFDENNKWIDGLEKIIDFNLSEPSYAAMVRYGFSSKVDFNLPPGRYRIRTVVRESLKSQMGSISRLIEVP